LPKLKERSIQQVPYVRVQRLIKGYGINGNKLSPILGCSSPHAKKKLDNPELFTLDDLDRISNYWGIPWEDFKDAMVR